MRAKFRWRAIAPGTIAYCFRVSCVGFHEQQQKQMLEKTISKQISHFSHSPITCPHSPFILLYSTASSVPLDSRRGVGGNNNIKALKNNAAKSVVTAVVNAIIIYI